jgi:hypothetical protein
MLRGYRIRKPMLEISACTRKIRCYTCGETIIYWPISMMTTQDSLSILRWISLCPPLPLDNSKNEFSSQFSFLVVHLFFRLDLTFLKIMLCRQQTLHNLVTFLSFLLWGVLCWEVTVSSFESSTFSHAETADLKVGGSACPHNLLLKQIS